MMFDALGRLFYVIVLLLNCVAILNEERFLSRIGFSTTANHGFGQMNGEESVKARLLSLIRATRTVMRPFLIAFNVMIIAYELVLG